MPSGSNMADRLRTRARRGGVTAHQEPSVSVASIEKDEQYVYVEAATSGFPNGVETIEWDLIDFFHDFPDQPFAGSGTGRTAKLEHNGPGEYVIRLNVTGTQGASAGFTQSFMLEEIPTRSAGGVGLTTAAIGVGALGLVGLAAVSY